MRVIATDVVTFRGLSVSLCLSVEHTQVSPAKTHEPIEMPSGANLRGPREDGGCTLFMAPKAGNGFSGVTPAQRLLPVEADGRRASRERGRRRGR